MDGFSCIQSDFISGSSCSPAVTTMSCHELRGSIAALLTQFLFTIIAWFLLLISPIWAGNHEEQGQGKCSVNYLLNSIHNCSDINSTIKTKMFDTTPYSMDDDALVKLSLHFRWTNFSKKAVTPMENIVNFIKDL